MTRRQHRQSSRWRRTISLLCMLSDQKIKVSYSRKPENLTVMISKMFSYCFSPLARGNDFFSHLLVQPPRKEVFFSLKNNLPPKSFPPNEHLSSRASLGANLHGLASWAYLSNERNPVCLGCLQDYTTQLYIEIIRNH